MSALRSLPRRLFSLVTAIRRSPGPVHVIVAHEASIELVARVCREMGVPLSPPSRTAAQDVSTGASRGHITASPDQLPHVPSTIHFSKLQPVAPDPVAEARIRAVLEEQWRTGVELPALAVWPSGSRLPAGSRLMPGRALADGREIGLGEDISACLAEADGSFPVGLREPCGELLHAWRQLRGRTAVTAVVTSAPPSHPILTAHLAIGAASLLNARYAGELTGNEPPSGPEDPRDRVERLASQLRLDPARVDVSQIAGQHVLLVGASWSAGWTMTVSGQLLLSAGAASVRPFTLTSDIRQAPRR